jgi:GNAT superfamily N-acetyltransferase
VVVAVAASPSAAAGVRLLPVAGYAAVRASRSVDPVRRLAARRRDRHRPGPPRRFRRRGRHTGAPDRHGSRPLTTPSPAHGDGREPLAAILAEAAVGRFPPADGAVTILPPPGPRDAGVISLTAHAVIFTGADPARVARLLPRGDLGAPLSPAFLQALAAATGRHAQATDLLAVAAPLPGRVPIDLVPADDARHPRLARAYRYRDDVRAWEAAGGLVLLGRGVAGRWEVAVEVDPGQAGRGLGRQLASAARHLVPGRAPLWAQVSPGNAASVRAFLAAGFVPVGAEALLMTEPE